MVEKNLSSLDVRWSSGIIQESFIIQFMVLLLNEKIPRYCLQPHLYGFLRFYGFVALTSY